MINNKWGAKPSTDYPTSATASSTASSPPQLTEQELTIKTLTVKLALLGLISTPTRAEIGPVITEYFFRPLPTTQYSKIQARAEDLAMAIGAESIVIQRVRDEVSFGIPNRKRSIISFNNCLYTLFHRSDEFTLPILMGQDTKGIDFSLDLCLQPHILIAGSTGSGKSVFLAQLITSLAIMKTPAELSFYLVDTKQLDLTLFAHLSHVKRLITEVPVLRLTLESLLQAVRLRTQMMRGTARNLTEWNALHPLAKDRLDYKVLVIDELADIIAQDKELARLEDKDTKQPRIAALLAQLAQISRAAGIHIIAATQRPSVQILSGDIKANFPTRICFKLPSSVDSRVVLDENGAEALLGKGDYFYKTVNDSSMKRAHSAFVQLEDIKRIIEQHADIRRSLLRT